MGTFQTFQYVLGLLLVLGLPPGLTWWLLLHPFVGFWRRAGVGFTMVCMTLYFMGTIGALFAARRTLMGPYLGTSLPLTTVGLLLFIAGVAIGVRRKKHLTSRILAGVPEVHSDRGEQGELLGTGPYAVIRNPRYVEITMLSIAYAAVANYAGPYVIALLAFPVIHLVVLLEERELLDRFGDSYRDYCKRVPRYLPRWR
jgi:protein-S-isoprenylcysteine O-methyltransferase Ste14